MAEVTAHAPGTFCWLELSTTNQTDAKRFYAGLFGWTFNEIPMAPGDVYTLLQLDGLEVAALYTMPKEQQDQGVPPHWLTYFAVVGADETARKARALGGRLLIEPSDVDDVGRLAVIEDPAGAAFAIWQAGSRIGARRVSEPGALCWTELITADTRAAGSFYAQLFGWIGEETPMGPGTYTVFKNRDVPAGGMMPKPAEWADVPPHWAIYFAVDDCDLSAGMVPRLGGKVLMPPTESPYGRFAVLQDPQGAAFSIIALTNPSA